MLTPQYMNEGYPLCDKAASVCAVIVVGSVRYVFILDSTANADILGIKIDYLGHDMYLYTCLNY